mgnify:CR=1 FL=1
MAVDMETATLFSCGFANHNSYGALIISVRSAMTPDGVKQIEVIIWYQNYVEEHVEIGIASLRNDY